jgi:hypothetical protein
MLISPLIPVVIPGELFSPIVIPIEAQRRAGTQGNGSIEDYWVPGLARGLARDDRCGCSGRDDKGRRDDNRGGY